MKKEKNSTNRVENENSSLSTKELLKTIVIALFLAFAITRFIAPTLVSGESMNPTLNNSDFLIANKMSYINSEPERRDIIIFNTKLENSKVLIKRVIGLPGDRIRITQGLVFVNGEKQDESYINGDTTNGEIDEVVEDGKVFVMGDNRGNSLDSRFSQVGQINQKDIIGKIVFGVKPIRTNFPK